MFDNDFHYASNNETERRAVFGFLSSIENEDFFHPSIPPPKFNGISPPVVLQIIFYYYPSKMPHNQQRELLDIQSLLYMNRTELKQGLSSVRGLIKEYYTRKRSETKQQHEARINKILNCYYALCRRIAINDYCGKSRQPAPATSTPAPANNTPR